MCYVAELAEWNAALKFEVGTLCERVPALELAGSATIKSLKRAEDEVGRQNAWVTELKKATGSARRVEKSRAAEDDLRHVRKELEKATAELWQMQKVEVDIDARAVEEYKKSKTFLDLVHETSA